MLEDAIPRMAKLTKKLQGITLIELMIALTLLGLLLGIGAPQFSSFIQARTVEAEARRLGSLLRETRSEARARSATVTLSRQGNNWSSAILGYQDADPGGNTDFDAAADDLFREEPASKQQIVVNSTMYADQWISFSPRGWLRESGAITLAVCPQSGDPAVGYYVSVNRIGNVRVRKINSDSNPRGCAP